MAVSARTGVHPLDMKLMYKSKERDSTAFLDIAGVKDKSKVVLVEDPTAQAKRLLEMRKADKMEKAAKSISAISLEVDRLATKVESQTHHFHDLGRVVIDDHPLYESIRCRRWRRLRTKAGGWWTMM